MKFSDVEGEIKFSSSHYLLKVLKIEFIFYEIFRKGKIMLNRKQLRDYRLLRGVSTRDVAKYSNISQPLVVQIENGDKAVTKYNHAEFVKGINEAAKAKLEAKNKKDDRQKKAKINNDND